MVLKARFLRNEGNAEEALKKLRQAADFDPTYAPAFYLLGEIYRGKGDVKQATEAFRKVIALNPSATSVYRQLAELSLASGDPNGAVAFADSAVKAAPRDAGARLTLVRALVERGNLALAAPEMERLMKVYPNSAPVLSVAGNIALRKKNYAEARRLLEAAFKLDPMNLETLSGLTAVDLASKQPASARARVDSELKSQPNRPGLMMLAARTYAATGELVSCRADAEGCDSSRRRQYPGLCVRSGQIYNAQGRLEEGRVEFDRIVQKEPGNVPARTMLGIVLRRQGKTPEAIAQYEQALRIDSRAPVAANNLAWIYAEQRRES